MLYILATATPPFDGADDGEILRNVQKMNYSMESTFCCYRSTIGVEVESQPEGLDSEDIGSIREEDQYK